MKNKFNTDLSNCLSLGKFEKAKLILKENINDIDVLYKDGIFFELAISKENSDILKALLNYFEENQLSKYDARSEEYINLQKNIVNILEIAIDGVNLSPKMKEVLSPYIDFEESVDSREHDFEDFDFNIPAVFEYEQDKEVKISGDNIIEHHQHTEIIS